jgi:hypothetical protein
MIYITCSSILTEKSVQQYLQKPIFAKLTENCLAIFAETNFSNNSVRRVIGTAHLFSPCIDYRLTSVLDPDLESECKKSKITHKKRKVKLFHVLSAGRFLFCRLVASSVA